MKLSAELLISEIFEKDEPDKESLLTLSCEEFSTDDVILTFENGRTFKVDGNDLMDALARISSEPFSRTKTEDD
jgi:hypothetical protein